MQVGLAVITLLLITIGTIRASLDGVPLGWTIVAALVLTAWYAAGYVGRESGALTVNGDGTSTASSVWWLAGFTLLWAGATVISPEYIWIAFSLWLISGLLLPLPWAVGHSFAVLAIVVIAPAVHTGETAFASVVGPLVGLLIAIGISRGYLTLIRDNQERRQLITSLVRTQEEMASLQDELAHTQRESGAIAERTRLSRDIHDTVAQSVSSIGMLSHAALENGSHDQATRALQQIQQLASDGLTDTRRIVNALMPAELEEGALAGALQRMLTRLNEEAGIDVALHVDDTFPALPTLTEVALLRTAQSALANVRTHSDAQRVVVNLVDAEDSVRLDIVDDGVGFDAELWNAQHSQGNDSGYGLRSMRARLRELGGGLDVESAPGDGAALSAYVPLSVNRRPE